ncbi:hypothetical protein [Embleya sp. NPDC005575]|uniref:hypothetical protein n=1 Tax=Embleya sp. NPDC005575 TaxID=3156892 RepID=UPI0033A8F171
MDPYGEVPAFSGARNVILGIPILGVVAAMGDADLALLAGHGVFVPPLPSSPTDGGRAREAADEARRPAVLPADDDVAGPRGSSGGMRALVVGERAGVFTHAAARWRRRRRLHRARVDAMPIPSPPIARPGTATNGGTASSS